MSSSSHISYLTSPHLVSPHISRSSRGVARKKKPHPYAPPSSSSSSSFSTANTTSKRKVDTVADAHTVEEPPAGTPLEGWVVAKELPYVSGPLLLLFHGDHGILALTADPTKGIYLSPALVPPPSSQSQSTTATTMTTMTATAKSPMQCAEPALVQQVWFAARMPGSTTPSYSLKSAHEFYLSCDQFGCVTADRIAVGPQEEWTLVQRDDGHQYALQSTAYTTYLRAEDGGGGGGGGGTSSTSGTSSSNMGRLAGTVRADSHECGYREGWTVKMHADRLLQAKREARLAALAPLKNKIKEANANVHHERLLDERVQKKSDRYCK